MSDQSPLAMLPRSDCVFCDEDKIVSPIEWEYGADSSLHMVFEPLDPVVEGHLLVVPVRHADDATEDRYLSAMAMSVASRIAARYESSNIITSIGAPATQTVMHLHLHVIPRYPGDGLALPWTTHEAPASKIAPKRGHW